jgi:tRNA-binding protein
MSTITYDDFARVDIRAGTILEAAPLEGARKPAYRLLIDFGPEIGQRKSSVQITVHYQPGELIGRQVAAVVNFPPRQIGPVVSEVLTLGFPDADGKVVLVQPSKPVPNGGRLF